VDVTIPASDPLSVAIADVSVAEPDDGDGDTAAHIAVTFSPATVMPAGNVSLTFTTTAAPAPPPTTTPSTPPARRPSPSPP